jgi:hypothetical protein
VPAFCTPLACGFAVPLVILCSTPLAMAVNCCSRVGDVVILYFRKEEPGRWTILSFAFYEAFIMHARDMRFLAGDNH